MSKPYITYDEHSKQWELKDTFVVDVQGGKHTLEIPGGFQFDLASIPRILWDLEAPFELSIAAPLVHDWLYRHGGNAMEYKHEVRYQAGGFASVLVHAMPLSPAFTRAEADAIFNELMARYGVSKIRRLTAYCGVRLFGGSSWKQG